MSRQISYYLHTGQTLNFKYNQHCFKWWHKSESFVDIFGDQYKDHGRACRILACNAAQLLSFSRLWLEHSTVTQSRLGASALHKDLLFVSYVWTNYSNVVLVNDVVISRTMWFLNYWIQDPRSRTLHPGSCIQDPGSRILEILDSGFRILDPASWIDRATLLDLRPLAPSRTIRNEHNWT